MEALAKETETNKVKVAEIVFRFAILEQVRRALVVAGFVQLLFSASGTEPAVAVPLAAVVWLDGFLEWMPHSCSWSGESG